MVDFAVFNELSLPFDTNINIEDKFILFFKLLKELQSRNLTKVRMDKEFKNYRIVEEIQLFQFFGQLNNGVLKDRLRNFIANEITKMESPLIKMDDAQEQVIILKNEYYYDEQLNTNGLACADIWNTVAISFNTDSNWNTSVISLKKYTIDDETNIVQKNINIMHALNNTHLATHITFFQELEEEIQLNITQETFWESKDTLFQNKIILCEEVEEQIIDLQKPKFYEALSILRDLEKGFKQLGDYSISGEGQTVKETPKLNKLRKFTIDGRKEFFWNHIKNFGDHRIHYIEKDDKIYIGYIGPHLPTKNDS